MSRSGGILNAMNKLFSKWHAVVPAAALAFILAFSCQGESRGNPSPAPNPNPPDPPNPPVQTSFDGEKAFDHLEAQMAFGNRIPGTSAHVKCGDYIADTLRGLGLEVEEQAFSVTIRGRELPMRNIIGRLGWETAPRANVILAAHWDTRPWADQDIPANRDKPVPGANDGASGVAVLLEMARIFAAAPPPVGVELVFFDGEDYGPELSAMFIGSKYFADRLSNARIQSYKYGVLLDMIGDKSLQIKPETSSEAVASDVYARIRSIAQELGYGAHFLGSPLQSIIDDHIPLIEKGVPMYDLIDFDYPYWHTIQDTADKCSAESLQIVGTVVSALVYMED